MSDKRNRPAFEIPKKVCVVLYAVTIILAVVARVYQLLTNVNYNTGRYLDDSIIKNTPLIIIVCGTILCFVALLFGDAHDKVIDDCILINPWRLRYDRLNKKMPMGVAYCSLIMCLLLIAEVIINFGQKISYGIEERDKIVDEVERKKYNIFSTITTWDVIEVVIIILVFLLFLTMAMNIIKKEGISRANCAAMSIFAAWKVCSIFMMFSENNVVSVSTFNVYDLMTAMLSTLFFVKVSRIFMGMEKKHSRYALVMLGYLTSVVAAVGTLPRYILLLVTLGYDSRLGMQLPNVSDVGLILVPAAIVSVFWTAYSYREVSKGTEEVKRWTLNARPKEIDMDDLNIEGVDTNKLEDKS